MVYTDLETLFPLADQKHGLGLWTGETDAAIEAQVTAFRAAALGWLKAVTGRHPLAAVGLERRIVLPWRDDPIRMWAPDGAFSALAYWQPGQTAGAVPSGRLGAAGRSMEDGLGELSIWPATDWPSDLAFGRQAILTLDFRWDIDEDDLGLLRSAALIYARSLFVEKASLVDTALRVIAPLRRPWLAHARS